MSAMASFTDASHNMLFRLNAAKWNPDLDKSGAAALVGYQEAEGDPQRKTLTAWSKAKGRQLYHPKHSGNPIGWDPAVFSELQVNGKPFQGTRAVHAGAIAMGINAKFNPRREFTWKGLTHRSSGQNVLRINVHPVAGATDPTPEEGAALTAWKDWAAGQYWLDVMGFAAQQLSVQRPSGNVKERAGLWDVILLGGDYNGDLLDQAGDQWYYPNRLLPALFRADSQKRGLDHLQAAHGSDVRETKRWTLAGNTDHRIHFITWELREVEDFPGAKPKASK